MTKKQQAGYKPVLAYNEVTLNEKEKKVMALPSKFQTFEKVDVLQMKMEALRATDKWRWNLRSEGRENGEENGENSDEPGESIQEVRARQPWDRSSKTLDLSKMRVTQLKSCTKVCRPHFTKNVKVETKIAEFTSIVIEETNDYNKEHPACEQALQNMTRDEKEGVKSLKRRTA